MTIPDLIRLLQNQIATLNGLMATAEAQGDVARVVALDAQILQTQATLEQLKTVE
jgi:hypothetical protein